MIHHSRRTTRSIAGLLSLGLLAPALALGQEALVLPENQGVVIAPRSGEVFIVPNDWQIVTLGGSCLTETAPPPEIGEIEELPPVVGYFEDSRGDFLLDHPLFEENFGVIYENNEVIPPELDIVSVEVNEDDGGYRFEILTAGETLADLLREAPRTVRFGVYIDADLNGLSDYLVTTTADFGLGVITGQDFGGTVIEAGVAGTRQDFGGVIEELEVVVAGNALSFRVPRNLVGDHFDWLAASGYSPEPAAFFRTPIENVFFVPAVDVATANGPFRMQEISTSYSGTGQQTQVTQTGYSTCPADGVAQQSVPGTRYQGVQIFKNRCGHRGLGLWCINRGFFGKRVFDVSRSQDGWVARCPFTCGYNQQNHWDTDGDGLPDKVYHAVTDADCKTRAGGTVPQDKDADRFRDTMFHTYWYNTNQVKSCNLERDAAGNLAILQNGKSNPRCLPPRPPYADPANVPGSI